MGFMPAPVGLLTTVHHLWSGAVADMISGSVCPARAATYSYAATYPLHHDLLDFLRLFMDVSYFWMEEGIQIGGDGHRGVFVDGMSTDGDPNCIGILSDPSMLFVFH
jgi:hypothetical protein